MNAPILKYHISFNPKPDSWILPWWTESDSSRCCTSHKVWAHVWLEPKLGL